MFRKLIFVIILINLITLNSSEQDNNDDENDLYRAFNEEQEKFISMFDKSNNNVVAIKEGSDGYQQDESYGADEEEGEEEEKSNENFNRFMQAIRDRSQFNAESAEAKKNVTSTEPPSLSTTQLPSNELANRVIKTLDEIREELENMRGSKTCSEAPDGSNCDLSGVWNAAEVGLHIQLNSTATDDNKLLVTLSEKIPRKSSHHIDSSWSCSGVYAHLNGGPFTMTCTQRERFTSEMAIFHGICKRCSGFDTIFGEWIFQHVPRDCRQLWTFTETRRDVFYKKVDHHESNQNSNEANQTSQNTLKETNQAAKSKRNEINKNSFRWNFQ